MYWNASPVIYWNTVKNNLNGIYGQYEVSYPDDLKNKWYLTPGQAPDKVSPTRCPRHGVPDPSFRCKHRGKMPNGSQACLTAVRLA